MINKVTSY